MESAERCPEDRALVCGQRPLPSAFRETRKALAWPHSRRSLSVKVLVKAFVVHPGTRCRTRFQRETSWGSGPAGGGAGREDGRVCLSVPPSSHPSAHPLPAAQCRNAWTMVSARRLHYFASLPSFRFFLSFPSTEVLAPNSAQGGTLHRGLEMDLRLLVGGWGWECCWEFRDKRTSIVDPGNSMCKGTED